MSETPLTAASASNDPNQLVHSLKRINLISGKGGVGRTTLAAILAKSSAAAGKRTLLAELEDESDWDSSLARCFGKKQFRTEPTFVEKNLDAIRLSALAGQEQFLNSFLKVSTLTHLILGNQGIQWFLEGAPAFREMGLFNHLLIQLKKNYDVIILDLPATGHMVGLARLPNLLLKMIPFGPIAERLKEGQAYFYDQKQTAAWVVTLPQSLPVSEAIELKNALQSEKIPVGGYILNRAPFNPFTEEEEKILESVSLKSKTQKLMVDLERIRRFRDAQKRLSQEYAGHVWIAPECFNPLEESDFGKRIQKMGPNV